MVKTKKVAAQEVHRQIEQQAGERVVREVRHIASIEVGRAVRQGDIYIHRVHGKHPHGKSRKSRQLAIGETRGSRHIAEAPAQVFEASTRPEWCGERTFLGPVIVAEERFLVTHPEHAHVSLPCGTYQVTHQTDARTLERVQD